METPRFCSPSLFCQAVLLALSIPAVDLQAAVHTTDGSDDDVRQKISIAQNGDTILIPEGDFRWSGGIELPGKVLHLRGVSGGRIDGASTSRHVPGLGSRTFSLTTAQNASGAALTSMIHGYNVGERVRAVFKGDGSVWMEGLVTSYDSSRLSINVTDFAGSGEYAAWNFLTAASTTIIHDSSSAALITLRESAEGHVVLSDLRLLSGAGASPFISIHPTEGGKAVLIHSLRVSNTGGNRIIHSRLPRGIIWNTYWDTGFRFSRTQILPGYGLSVKDDGNASSWEQPSTLGAQDLTGQQNFYVEDSYFAGLLTESFDADGGSRLVVRNSVFDNSGFTSHGADTGPIGQRHFELYNNLWLFEDLGSASAAMTYAIYIRGGTAVICDNYIPNIRSSHWGDKPEVVVSIQNLQRNAGPNPLWGAGVSGVQYPAPRQAGFGRVSGQGRDGLGRSHDGSAYVGDPEPIYQWGNGGGSNLASPSIQDYATPLPGQDSSRDYVVLGRDYINGVRPGYSKFSYPHPLRSNGVYSGPLPPIPPARLVVEPR